MNKEQALQTVKELVIRFNEQILSYKKADYNETQTRRDFIDPFFKALGWDIDNSEGCAESYREVIHEDKVKVGGATKAPDYSFRLSGGQRLFFVEAKKPSVSIKDDIEPSYQLRRYGWNAKLKVSILTDFEELAIYDCTKKPKPTDKSGIARIKYINFNDYEKEWDFIWNTFSKESVKKGSFDKFNLGTANKKGTETVDQDFLESLDKWRILLAETISKENKQLDEYELNYVVQQTLDRIVFLRICEDRNIEEYGKLQNAIKSGNYYQNLLFEFYQADQKYNSGLFSLVETRCITSQITINNKTIKSIVNQLYYPECPYEFSVLSVEILGSAYEQFLGKTITINARGKAIIDLKPEVRKAGGVYYTPQYIVDYIVRNTIGNIITNSARGHAPLSMTPEQVAELKIVDPACGSGSFLLGAYQFLLDWHKEYYLTRGHAPLPLTKEGNLTSNEKKRILLNNIYGVDIDVNAVEVTKLSLLLKCLEGETMASIEQQTKMFKDRVLPTLDNNIKSGNSLIDVDYYDSVLEFGEERKIKPFSWKKEFPQVFGNSKDSNASNSKGACPLVNSGFDVVIGNPPYVTLQLGKKQKSQKNNILDYYKSHFSNSFEYKANLFALFIQKGVNLLSNNGLLSFIVPNTFYNVLSFKLIRKYLINSGRINSLLDLRFKVFEGAEIGGSAIFVYENSQSNGIINYKKVDKLIDFDSSISFNLLTENIKNDIDFNFVQSDFNTKLINRINSLNGVEELGKLTKIYQGIITGNNKKFVSKCAIDSNWKPIIKGRDINKYSIKFDNNFVYYVPSELWSNTEKKMFDVPEKIISRQTSDKLIGAIDTNQYLSLDSTHVMHLLNPVFDLKYLLGIYNSNLINFIYQSRVNEGGRVFAQVKTVNVKPLPIKTIDFSNKSEVAIHDKIVNYVSQLLQLNKDIQTLNLETQKQEMKRKIDYFEDKINELVYGLYGLNEEEVGVIEK